MGFIKLGGKKGPSGLRWVPMVAIELVKLPDGSHGYLKHANAFCFYPI